ncbi:hypothetical protein M9979_05420 [Sphingomonas sp. RP10(2022)]|uniref:Uncharacterized protein n=1 Tax=Sphingomonas liriopis TaxID=2949094 RepID=A0A9X2HR40_9SPHN|nr:hypothetical protein [Sphingomonas liriopis]MCP3734317.1 hypothetical protein [Sphingomonas liriopis]
MTGKIITLSALAASALALASPAHASGCNGVVNFFVWGCAPWDNNNGPNYPYYRKKVVTMKAPAGSRIEEKNGAAMIDINGQKFPLANGVIAPGGANVIAPGGANVIAPGGANVQVVVPG